MISRTPRSTHTYTLLPYSTRFRSHREPRDEFYNRDLGGGVKLEFSMRIFSLGDRQHRADERRELARIARLHDAAHAHRGDTAVGHHDLGRRIAIEFGNRSADRLVEIGRAHV